jgi:hypothetical protein
MTEATQKPIPKLTANDAKAAVGRCPQNKIAITHIPGTTTDAAKAALIGNIQRSLAAKAKKFDLLVIILEDPNL